MKRVIRKFFRALGYDLVKAEPAANLRSVHTGNLTFYKTKTGNYYLPSDAHQDVIANAIKKDQVFDVEIYDLAKKYVKPGSTVLDVGSNFGQMAVMLSKLVGPSGIVHAFDADDFVYKVLEKNTKENAANIITHFGAVHNVSNETLYFPVQDFEKYGTYGSYGIDYVHGKGRPVKTITIDDIQFDLPVSFMKVDVQGGDLFALKGAVKTIEKYKMPIIFEYEYAFEEEMNLNFQEYVDFVRSINYKFDKVVNGQNYLITPIK